MGEILEELPKAVLDKAFRGELVDYDAKEINEENIDQSAELKRPDGSGQVTLEDF